MFLLSQVKSQTWNWNCRFSVAEDVVISDPDVSVNPLRSHTEKDAPLHWKTFQTGFLTITLPKHTNTLFQRASTETEILLSVMKAAWVLSLSWNQEDSFYSRSIETAEQQTLLLPVWSTSDRRREFRWSKYQSKHLWIWSHVKWINCLNSWCLNGGKITSS